MSEAAPALQPMLVGGGEPAAGRLAAACNVLARGGDGHSQARALYAQLRAQPHREAATWANMAALAIALGDHEGALRHAQRATVVDPGCSAAWVNGAVALWRQRRWPECEAALRRAWAQPGAGEAVVLNLATFLRAHLREDAAGEVLAEGARRVPSAWRIALAHAESARVRMLHATVRAEALRALSLLGQQLDPGLPGRSGLRPAAGADVRAVLGAACNVLDRTGVVYHLMAGTLLAIAKDGQLFPHDKDVDMPCRASRMTPCSRSVRHSPTTPRSACSQPPRGRGRGRPWSAWCMWPPQSEWTSCCPPAIRMEASATKPAGRID